MANKEFEEQATVVHYLKLQYPDVFFVCDLSGVYMPKMLAYKMARIKGPRGCPDILIFDRHGGCNGLAIELKSSDTNIYKKDGTLRKDEHIEEQLHILETLRKQGWLAEFARGAGEAIQLIDSYMKSR